MEKERPILFSTPMVKAILAGDKTMTRRVIKPQPVFIGSPNVPFKTNDADPKGIINCPYGTEGDSLWVRETTCIAPKNWAPKDDTCIQDPDGDMRHIAYKADTSYEGRSDTMKDYGLKWTPSIHVPKWAARIWLKVKSVRVEPLKAITRDDAISEGIDVQFSEIKKIPLPIKSFALLWDSINGKPRKDGNDISWTANPWVWVVEFERIEKPITTTE